jgi:hypothetical protein
MKIEIKLRLRAMFLTAGIVLASFCSIRAQVCTQAVNMAERSLDERDTVDRIDLVASSVEYLKILRCMTGCRDENDAISPEERDAMNQAAAFAYSPQGRTLTKSQLSATVRQWCVRTYGGQ